MCSRLCTRLSDNSWALSQLQVALNDGRLGFSTVNNIPHAERHGMFPFVRLHTTRMQVSPSVHDVAVGADEVWMLQRAGVQRYCETRICKECMLKLGETCQLLATTHGQVGCVEQVSAFPQWFRRISAGSSTSIGFCSRGNVRLCTSDKTLAHAVDPVGGALCVLGP